MTTSGTYSLSVNKDQIVRLALLNIEVIDEIETPSPQDTQDVTLFLNMLMKQWMGTKDFSPGLKSWTLRHGFVFLDGRTGKYVLNDSTPGWTNSFVKTSTTVAVSSGNVVSVDSVAGMVSGDNFGLVLDANYIYWTKISSILGLDVTITGTVPSQASSGAVVYNYTTNAQQPLEIRTAFLRDAYNSDTPLRIMMLPQYDILPNKADTTNIGDPTAIYYEWQLTEGDLYLDVGAAEDLTKYVCMSYLEEIQDITNPNDTPEFPQEWFLPLALGTSKLIAPMYKRQWTDTHESNYSTSLAIAQKKGPTKETMYFQCGED